MFEVNCWGTHPEKNNDDCYEAKEFATQKEAMDFTESGDADHSVQYFEIIGEKFYLVKKNPHFVEDDSDREWRREIANQAGMAGGCEAYNDAMGY